MGVKINIRLFLVLFLGFSLLVAGGNTAGDKQKKLDQLMKWCFKKGLFNGGILVAARGKVIYNKTFGTANPETGENIHSNSRFRLASVSKQFTAMAIMILQEKGKLSYEDDIRKFLPELPYKKVTIYHLLTHTSGLPDYIRLMDMHWDVANRGKPERKIASNEDVVAMLAKHYPKRLFKPGTKYKYSNTGYLLLGTIVKRVSNQSFADFLRDHIFKPLNMNDSLVFDPTQHTGINRRVIGFRQNLGDSGYTLVDHHYLNGVAGDGGIYSTLIDLFKWDQALYEEKMVKQTTLQRAFTPILLKNGKTHDYGFGWGIGKAEDGSLQVAHSGGWVGFRTFIAREIENRNTIIILTNDSNPSARSMLSAIGKILHGKEFKLPLIPITRIIAKTILTKDIEAATQLYWKLKSEDPVKYDFREGYLNWLGYQLLGMGKKAEAVAIFQLNAKAFPSSWNVWDSLAEGFMENGDREKAIKYYKKSIKMNPKNENGKKKLKTLKQKKSKSLLL